MISTRKEQIIVNQWAALLRLLKRDIGDDYRVEGCEDTSYPMMTVTFGLDTNGEWAYQTGDNSFSGGAYGFAHWGVIYLTRRSNCKELAQYAFNEAAEQFGGAL
jgi:hypothetical protein